MANGRPKFKSTSDSEQLPALLIGAPPSVPSINGGDEGNLVHHRHHGRSLSAGRAVNCNNVSNVTTSATSNVLVIPTSVTVSSSTSAPAIHSSIVNNTTALSPPRQLIRNLEDKLLHYGVLDMTWVIMSIFTYTFDQTMDVLVAIYFYNEQRYLYCWLTSTFIVVPALTMTGFSLAWYIHDYKQGLRPPASRLQWTFRAISLFLHFGPILRYIESMVYGCKSRCGEQQKRRFFFMMIYEDTDAGLLRLFESFMEAAPQLVLQICILVRNDMPESVDHPFKIGLQVVSIVSSLVSLSWALASYNRSLRFSLDNKRGMTWPGTIVQFFWYFFNVASRVLALALFASQFPRYIFIVCFVHWTAMTSWIYWQKTEFCTREWQEFLFDLVMGVIYIFCFFNVKDEPTRYKYVFYYVVVFCEGSSLMALWFVHSEPTLWYRYLAFGGYFGLFALSIGIMVLYYQSCHPSRSGQDSTMKARGLGPSGDMRHLTSVADVGVQTTDGVVGPRMRSMRFYPAVPDVKCAPRRYSKKIGRVTENDLEHPLNTTSADSATIIVTTTADNNRRYGASGNYVVEKIAHETMA